MLACSTRVRDERQDNTAAVRQLPLLLRVEVFSFPGGRRLHGSSNPVCVHQAIGYEKRRIPRFTRFVQTVDLSPGRPESTYWGTVSGICLIQSVASSLCAFGAAAVRCGARHWVSHCPCRRRVDLFMRILIFRSLKTNMSLHVEYVWTATRARYYCYFCALQARR